MPARRRITGCWRRSWPRAASPAGRTCWNARRASPLPTVRISIRIARWRTPVGGWHIRHNLFKYHAACYLTHAPIEAARKLREQHGLTPDRIARITLELDEACDRVCNIPAPRTGLEAKFSLRLTTAMGLAGVDTGRLSSYSETTTADPMLVALRDKVDFTFRQGTPHTQARLDLLLNDGQRLTAEHDSGVPAADVGEQGRRLQEKFAALVEPVFGSERCRQLIAQIDRLDLLGNVRDLMRLCAG